MKNFYAKLFLFVFLSFITSYTNGQSFFKDVQEPAAKGVNLKRVIIPSKYRTLALDTGSLQKFFKTVPSEKEHLANNVLSKRNSSIIDIPLPQGGSEKFRIWETPTMAPELAAAYPNIKTYTGQGIDDRTATIKIDWTELGFHAMILSPTTTSIFIDNYWQGEVISYISYYKSDFIKKERFIEYSRDKAIDSTTSLNRPAQTLATKQCIGGTLRTYRLAVACTGEYAKAATGKTSPTKAQTLSAIVTTVNRVDGVYETELAIRLVLIANDTAVIYTNPATDPFTGNNDATILIDESQTVIDANIGNANYDVGHTFSTGGGGLSSMGVVCQSGEKASSITGSPVPVGDPYDIDYVSHEVGHAFGADHPFNSALGNCQGNGNRSPLSTATNAEPGSGSTIMAYAGICDADDLQPHSDPQFHAISLDYIATYTRNSSGNTCAVITNTGNTPPVVNALTNYRIPKGTPFVLTGSATDADGDALTYCWEQMDVGGAFGAWNVQPTGTGNTINVPLFRSFRPTASPTRYFPKLSDVINNTTTIGEVMPAVARTLHFRLTARDNRAGGGGICFAETADTVIATAGPFIVTYPDATGVVWTSGETRTVTWNPANTQSAPINCANVTIQLSTDGGNTYPVTLLASTPNDGTQDIVVPANATSQARIRIMAVGNVFYDISNNNFTITAPTFNFNVPDTVKICGADSGSAKLKAISAGGFSSTINLSVADNPSGTTVSFINNPLTPGDTAIVTLENVNTLSAGTYNITVTGVAGSTTKTQVLTFVVASSTPAAPILNNPANLSTGQATATTFNWSAIPGASSYTLEISISNTFATHVDSITNITTNSYVHTTPLTENTIYYWRVTTSTLCGTSAPSSQFLFKTGTGGCSTFVSTNVPISISTGTPSVLSTLTVPAANSVTIGDINVVGITGTHSNISDLTFTLSKVTPAITDSLVNQICSSGQFQNFSFNLDDQAATSIFPCPPTGDITVAPASPLSVFNGQTSGGTWRLRIKDNVAGNGGSLTGWGLQICSVAATPLDLTYIFNGNGNWDVPSNWVNSSVPPATMITGSTIIIDPVVDGECYLNIPYTVAPGSSLTVMPNKIFRVPSSFTIQQN